MPNGQQPPKRQQKSLPGKAPELKNVTAKNTRTVVAVCSIGILVLFAAIYYFSS